MRYCIEGRPCELRASGISSSTQSTFCQLPVGFFLCLIFLLLLSLSPILLHNSSFFFFFPVPEVEQWHSGLKWCNSALLCFALYSEIFFNSFKFQSYIYLFIFVLYWRRIKVILPRRDFYTYRYCQFTQKDNTGRILFNRLNGTSLLNLLNYFIEWGIAVCMF